MNRPLKSRIDRREFLNRTALAGGLAFTKGLAAETPQSVAILADPGDAVANTKPAMWAAGELEYALSSRGVKVSRISQGRATDSFDFCVVAAGAGHNLARAFLNKAGVSIPAVPE